VTTIYIHLFGCVCLKTGTGGRYSRESTRYGLHKCDYHIYTFVWLCVSKDWDWGRDSRDPTAPLEESTIHIAKPQPIRHKRTEVCCAVPCPGIAAMNKVNHRNICTNPAIEQ
jgi:hypothetical protein